MKKVLLIKYGEIALRGKNRGLFEKKLIQAIRKNLVDVKGDYYVIKEQGRLILENLDGDIDYDKVIDKVSKVLGIVAVCPCVKINDNNIEVIQKNVNEYIKSTYDNYNFTFKVKAKRSNKNYPLLSNEICAEIGHSILLEFEDKGMSVDVKSPEEVITVELRNDVYIFSKIIDTFGGLPYGSSGNATLLLSGGIDSPVAGFLMAKRGVCITCVYFDSPPYTSVRAKEKVLDLAKVLASFTAEIKLYIIPFTNTQLFIYDSIPPEKTTILMKRIMLKISEMVNEKENGKALITGDAIGQVASQTISAIDAISSGTNVPILRPLAGMDKNEIIKLARKIGTFDISTRPYEDCCTIFVPEHPEINPKKSIIESFEQKLFDNGIEKLMEEAFTNAEILKF